MSSARTSASTGLFISGERESGDDVRVSNVTAAIAVANMIKSSLGPTGLDKMLVDDIGDVTVTNDGATILAQMEVEHPAARLLVDLAQLQDKEVGDGTTSVVLIAAELLRRGNDLVRFGNIHPTTVLAGFRIALKAAVAYIKSELIVQVSALNDEHLLQAAVTSMSSKLIAKEGLFFAQLAVDAVKSVETTRGDDGDSTKTNKKKRYPLSAIHILKAHGKSSLESELLRGGFALQAVRASQGMPTCIEGTMAEPVKIAMLDMNLQRHRMAMGITITVKDPAEVENIKRREMDITKEKIAKIIATGAKVVLTTKGIDDLCLKYFVESGVLCCRRINRDDLYRLAKASGGKVVTTMADMEGDESFDSTSLGTCESVREVRIGDGEMLHFYNCHSIIPVDSADADAVAKVAVNGASTIILRGANEYMLDEMDRALHDALCVVKRMLESNTLVPGGGAVEVALSVYLEQYALQTLDTREQLAIIEFAEAMLVIPKTLAVNAAKDSSELVARLRSIHARSIHASGLFANSTDGSQNIGDEADIANFKYYGLDLVEGEIRNNLLAGVVEPAVSKIKALRFATEAAITILRIDDRITVAKDQ